MDPNEAWSQLGLARANEEWAEAREYAEALLGWLTSGGFVPMAGKVTRDWDQQTMIAVVEPLRDYAELRASCTPEPEYDVYPASQAMTD